MNFAPAIHRLLRRALVPGLLFVTLQGALAQSQIGPVDFGPPVYRYVYRADHPAAESAPRWFREIPAPDGLTDARRDFQVIPPKSGLELAVTISFDEGADPGRLKAYFRSARQGREIATNLHEGIGLPNQRTIIIRKRFLEGPGVLSLIAEGPELLVWRMELQWLQARPVLVPLGSILESPAVVLGDGSVLQYDELASGDARAPEEGWLDNIITFPLVREPQRIESGVEYAFTLETVPNMAMINLDLAGLAPQTQVRVMVNDQVGGWLQVALPTLAHGGYRMPEALEGTPSVAGWRRGQAWIPRSVLKDGENVLWLEFFDPAPPPAEGDIPAALGLQPAILFGLALRHLGLELDYTPAPVFPRPEDVLAEEELEPVPDFSLPQMPDTSNDPPAPDSSASEQTGELPVSSNGEFSYDLMGDMAPALQLFLDEAPKSGAIAGPKPAP